MAWKKNKKLGKHKHKEVELKQISSYRSDRFRYPATPHAPSEGQLPPQRPCSGYLQERNWSPSPLLQLRPDVNQGAGERNIQILVNINPSTKILDTWHLQLQEAFFVRKVKNDFLCYSLLPLSDTCAETEGMQEPAMPNCRVAASSRMSRRWDKEEFKWYVINSVTVQFPCNITFHFCC